MYCPGRCAIPAVLAEIAGAPGLQRQLARGLGHLLIQVVRRPRALAAAPRPHRRPALARGRRPRSARAPLRGAAGRRLDPAAGRRRALARSLRRAGRRLRLSGTAELNAAAAGRSRTRGGADRCVSRREAESESEFRPRPRTARAGFGGSRRPRNPPPRPRSSSAISSCAAASTASTSPPTAQRDRPRLQDRQVGRPPTSSASEGTLQIQLYMIAAREFSGWIRSAASITRSAPPTPTDAAPAGWRSSDERARRARTSCGPTGSPQRSSSSCSRRRGARDRGGDRDARRRDPPRSAQRRVPEVVQLPADLPPRACPRRRRRGEQRTATS